MNECVFEIRGDCIALTEKRCEKCAFKKTRDELINGRMKFFDRLPLLPPARRIHLLEWYYGVNKGW